MIASGVSASTALTREDENANSVFFARLEDAHARATSAAGATSYDFTAGGVLIRVVIAGSSLLPFLEVALPLRAPSAEDGKPDLTVKIWDTRTGGVAAPRPPREGSSFGPRGELLGHSDGSLLAASSHASGALSVLDASRRTGFFWVREPEDLTLHECGAPLLLVLCWYFHARGAQLVHAASVGTNGRAVLFAGPGGSGKSTSALACRAAGLRHLADDYALVSDPPTPSVHPLFATAKLNADSLALLPDLASAVTNPARPPGEKALLSLGSEDDDSRTWALRALLFPRVHARGDSTLSPLHQGEALRALAPSTLLQLAGTGASAFSSLAALVRSVPAYRLDVGSDLPALASRVRELLAS